jgi:hypothetical protein
MEKKSGYVKSIIDVIERKLGVKKQIPQSMEDAVVGANSGYRNKNLSTSEKESYLANCQRSVPVYELRRRGYNLKARPVPSTGFGQVKNGAECFVSQNGKVLRPIRVKKGKEELLKELNTFPDGSRFGIMQQWSGRDYGHVYIAEKIDGEIIFMDPQDGKIDVSNNLNEIKKAKDGFKIWYYRMDNAIINQKIDWKTVAEEDIFP